MRKIHISFMAFMASAQMVMAQNNAGEIADGLRGQVSQGASFISAVAFFVGIIFILVAGLKFYAHQKNPNDPSNKISSAFVLIGVGAALVALPMVLGSGITTIFGSVGETVSADGGFTGL